MKIERRGLCRTLSTEPAHLTGYKGEPAVGARLRPDYLTPLHEFRPASVQGQRPFDRLMNGLTEYEIYLTSLRLLGTFIQRSGFSSFFLPTFHLFVR